MFKRLKDTMLVLVGKMKPVPKGFVVINKANWSKQQTQYNKMIIELDNLQYNFTLMTESKESIRRKLRKERMLTGNLLSVLDHVVVTWNGDAFPASPKMLDVMKTLQLEMAEWDNINRLEYSELLYIRENSVDEQDFRDKIHKRYQELKEESTS